MALRWRTPSASIASIVREPYQPEMPGPFAMMWDQLVSRPLNYEDEASNEAVVREYEYSVTAGSARKPNRERDQANMTLAAQTYLPIFQGYWQMTGDPTPLNNFSGEFAKAYELLPEILTLPPIQMQPPPVDPNQQPVEQGVA